MAMMCSRMVTTTRPIAKIGPTAQDGLDQNEEPIAPLRLSA
jgi:hypothetical protein